MPAPSPADTRTDVNTVHSFHSAETVTALRAPAGPGARCGAPEPPRTPRPGGPAGGPGAEAANDVVRWGVFCCVLVPVVLVVYGTSLGGAAGTAFGLAAVTAACRVLLRRAERGLRAERSEEQAPEAAGEQPRTPLPEAARDLRERRDHSRS
ncbi:hypothetical protein [Streptomyces sp. NPDC004267]|uniref:hypothetical protein n=1 Tax=Streptomyces sp. NPDC004267 TaxID=3364694 RepID=UPI0036BF28E2